MPWDGQRPAIQSGRLLWYVHEGVPEISYLLSLAVLEPGLVADVEVAEGQIEVSTPLHAGGGELN